MAQTIEIYGNIGEGENTPEAVSRKIKALGLKARDKTVLRLNSPGGDCFMGNAIFNMLVDTGAKWTIFVDGVAASMGSLIAALPDAQVVIAANAFIMIHNPAAYANGGSEDMARTARLLDSIRDGMAMAYAKRTGLPLEQIIAMMHAETWLDADEAIRLGFADSKGAEQRLAASARDVQKFGYRHAPVPKSIAEVSASYWTARGKGPFVVPDDPDDVSDLVPEPITAAKAFANFHGAYARRK